MVAPKTSRESAASAGVDAVAGGRITGLAALLLDRGLAGVPPLSSAAALASEYRTDRRYANVGQRVDALINSETAKNYATGFVTGLGGVVALPVAVPSALAASWLLQARLAGTIASLYGHDLDSKRVRSLVLVSLAGDVARDALEDFGVREGDRLSERALSHAPGRVLVEVNKRIGLRLLTQAWWSRIFNLSRVVPILGGVVAGSLDATVCRAVGRTAKSLFESGPRRRRTPSKRAC